MAGDNMKTPENLLLKKHGSHMEIVWKWSSPNLVALFVAVFGLCWFFFGYLQLGEMLQSGTSAQILRHELGKPFPFNLMAPAIASILAAMVYSITAGIFNRTTISVSRDRIQVRHGPLPWPGNSDIGAASIRQVFIKVKPARKRIHNAFLHSPYDVMASDVSGRPIRLVAGLKLTGFQASFIERQIEDFLGLKDAPPGIDGIAEEGLTLDQHGIELVLDRKWFNDRTVPLTIFSLVWSGCVGVYFWQSVAERGLASILAFPPEPALIIQLLLLAIGILLAYRATAEWLNRTEVIVRPGRLSVREGPLPWRGNLELAWADQYALSVEKSRWGSSAAVGSSVPVYKFDVHVMVNSGKSRKLIGGFDTSEQAERIQKKIREYLEGKSNSPAR
jgi:hypothetical protein